MLAIESHERLVGGLAFTRAPSPSRTDPHAMWINTVFVSPACRNKGIDSKLISHAERVARRFPVEELFVFADKPEIYKRFGWQELRSQAKNSVLWKSL